VQLVALGVQERLGEVLFKINTSCRIGQARRALETCSGFKERMPTVARLRATVGYMAEVEAQPDRNFLLNDNPCRRSSQEMPGLLSLRARRSFPLSAPERRLCGRRIAPRRAALCPSGDTSRRH
jgi:hypothetical protein